MRRQIYPYSLTYLLILVAATVAIAGEWDSPADESYLTPVCAIVELPGDYSSLPEQEISVTMTALGQPDLTMPGQIIDRTDGMKELWWLIPGPMVGMESRWAANLRHRPSDPNDGFSYADSPGQYLDLLFQNRNVNRYMYASDDISDTYKVFQHVFDENGIYYLTKGPGGLYTHHRGLFLGWKSLQADGVTDDFWHMKNGVVQQHQEFSYITAGPVLAKSVALIHWINRNGVTVVEEKRQTLLFRQPSDTIMLLEFRTELKAINGEVFLGGDPEHAGYQYRAHNDVSTGPSAEKATYLFHADGIDPKSDTDLPWTAMSYGLNGKRYSVQHMNHPDNPSPTIYSAYRDYGRFGAFFEKTIPAGQSLHLRYRIWVIQADMPTRSRCGQNYQAFLYEPEVSLSHMGLETYANFANQWLNPDCPSTPDCVPTDLNGDHRLDAKDLDILSRSWLDIIFHIQPDD